MYTWTTILIIAAVAGWFLYGLSRMAREAAGKDCASCALRGSFDYGRPGPAKTPMRAGIYRSVSGHMIFTDEEAARKRRERIRALRESGRKQG